MRHRWWYTMTKGFYPFTTQWSRTTLTSSKICITEESTFLTNCFILIHNHCLRLLFLMGHLKLSSFYEAIHVRKSKLLFDFLIICYYSRRSTFKIKRVPEFIKRARRLNWWFKIWNKAHSFNSWENMAHERFSWKYGFASCRHQRKFRHCKCFLTRIKLWKFGFVLRYKACKK